MAADIVYLRKEKVLLDTSVYISQITQGLYLEVIERLISSSVFYLSSVVFEELVAGARSDRELKELHKIKKPFAKTGRMVTPSDNDWEEAGLLMRALVRKGLMPSSHIAVFSHDVLIALSARRQGIRVVTANGKDFEKIRSLKDFKLTVW